jgi:hypothetical protein
MLLIFTVQFMCIVLIANLSTECPWYSDGKIVSAQLFDRIYSISNCEYEPNSLLQMSQNPL